MLKNRTSPLQKKKIVYFIEKSENIGLRKIKICDDTCTIYNLSENTNIRKVENIVKKLKRKEIKSVVLSKELHKNQCFINELDSNEITIFDGKWLMQYMIVEMIEYLETKNKITSNDEVSILANYCTEEIEGNIRELAVKFKNIRIVTNHIEKFKKIEEKLYEEKGISIMITNNKKRALSKSELIINFDFVQELINQYNISENAYIINLDNKIRINKKRFSGTVITDYEVEINCKDENDEKEKDLCDIYKKIDKYNNYYTKEIIESNIYEMLLLLKIVTSTRFNDIKRIIQNDKIQIKELYGMNGIV